jgi:hypothetical protein
MDALIIAALGPDVFDMDKPVVFAYEEIFSSTEGFSDSNLLGHGTYGSVYYSLLRDQVRDCIFKVSYSIYKNVG